MTRHLLIDSDPGIDDALAILLALRSADARVEAATTVAGNVAVDRATANARRILAVGAPDPPPRLAAGRFVSYATLRHKPGAKEDSDATSGSRTAASETISPCPGGQTDQPGPPAELIVNRLTPPEASPIELEDATPAQPVRDDPPVLPAE